MSQVNSTERNNQVAELGDIGTNEEPRREEYYKLLLLGTGEAGKSTIFKQLRLNYCEGASDSLSGEMAITYPFFVRNLGYLFKTLIRLYGTTGDATIDRDMNTRYGGGNIYQRLMVRGRITDKGVKTISRIWESKNAQEIWKRRNEFQLSESLEYFCQPETLNRMKDIDFGPTPEDDLHCCMRTTGLLKMELLVNGSRIDVIDAGGYRVERKNWFKKFDNGSSIMFVVALDEFDKVLNEDESSNRWDETLSVFEKIVNHRTLKKTPFILILNKVDLLKKKLVAKESEGENLDDYFPELLLGTNYDEAELQVMEYMEHKLVANLGPTQPYLVQHVNAVDIDAFPQWFKDSFEWMKSIC